METHLGHCLFIIFSKWIWLFALTSILGGTKAELRCIPSCQLPLIKAVPRELSELDLTNFGEAPTKDFVGFTDRSPGAKPADGDDEKHNVAELTASDESLSKVQPRLEGNNASWLQKDGLNGQQKLSGPKVFPGSASPAAAPSPSEGSVTENRTGDGKNNTEENGAQGDVTVGLNEDTDTDSWRRTRSARSAETWSEFRPEDGEDAAFSDQEEFELTSSTFALTGDTAHNQAMVHWSGQNSSVSR